MSIENLTTRSIRNNNSYNILKALVEKERLQRSELTVYSNVSVITVNKIVDGLLTAGILQETVVTSNIGRKPKELSFKPQLGCFCCINLCKTSQIGYFIYDIHSKMLAEGNVPVDPDCQFAEAFDVCISKIRRIAEGELNRPLLGAAVSVPSVYYEKEDAVNCDLIQGLKDVHFKMLLEQGLEISNIVIIHDVCAAADLEYQLTDSESLYYFYVGDGLGSAFVRCGEVFYGDSHAAGEIGQCYTVFDGKEQTYECILSLPGLCSQLKLSGQEELERLLLEYPDIAEDKRERLVKLLDFTAEILYNICWILNPGTIVVDSGLPSLASLIQQHSEEKCRKIGKSLIRNEVKITLPQEKNHYAMSGCMTWLVNNWIADILNKACEIRQDKYCQNKGEERGAT